MRGPQRSQKSKKLHTRFGILIIHERFRDSNKIRSKSKDFSKDSEIPGRFRDSQFHFHELYPIETRHMVLLEFNPNVTS